MSYGHPDYLVDLAKARHQELIAEADRHRILSAARRHRRRLAQRADLGSRSPVRAGPRLPQQRTEAQVEQKVA
jgi:hypothetical protein